MPDLRFMYRGSYRNAGGHLVPGVPYCLTKTYTCASDNDWNASNTPAGQEQPVITYPSTARSTQVVALSLPGDTEVRVHFLSEADGNPMAGGNYVPLRSNNSSISFNVAHRRFYITIVNTANDSTSGETVEVCIISELSGHGQDVIYESGDGLG